MEFEVINDINSKFSLCWGDITKSNADAIVISTIKVLIGGGVIYGAFHEVDRPGLLGECQKLNGCETGKYKVTLGYKLPKMCVSYCET